MKVTIVVKTETETEEVEVVEQRKTGSMWGGYMRKAEKKRQEQAVQEQQG